MERDRFVSLLKKGLWNGLAADSNLDELVKEIADRLCFTSPLPGPRDCFLDVLRGELGNGEEKLNNAGPHVRKYFAEGVGWIPRNLARDADDKTVTVYDSWCAAFVCYGLRKAGYKAWVSAGAKKLGQHLLDDGGEEVGDLNHTQPGDILIWDRGRAGSPAGHVAAVTRVTTMPDGLFAVDYIEGNMGSFPAVVTEKSRVVDFVAKRLELIVRPNWEKFDNSK